MSGDASIKKKKVTVFRKCDSVSVGSFLKPILQSKSSQDKVFYRRLLSADSLVEKIKTDLFLAMFNAIQ